MERTRERGARGGILRQIKNELQKKFQFFGGGILRRIKNEL